MDDVRASWTAEWELINKRTVEAKDASSAPLILASNYRRLSKGDRTLVDAVLAEALGSDEEWRRYDASALISQFRIVSALPFLERLADRLTVGTTPGAPYELNKVRRVIAKLLAPADS